MNLKQFIKQRLVPWEEKVKAGPATKRQSLPTRIMNMLLHIERERGDIEQKWNGTIEKKLEDLAEHVDEAASTLDDAVRRY